MSLYNVPTLVAGPISLITLWLLVVERTRDRRPQIEDTLKSHFEGRVFETEVVEITISKVAARDTSSIFRSMRNNCLPMGVDGNEAEFWMPLPESVAAVEGLETTLLAVDGVSDVDLRGSQLMVKFHTIQKGELERMLTETGKAIDSAVASAERASARLPTRSLAFRC